MGAFLFLFCGLGFSLQVLLISILFVETIVIGFRSSATDPLRSSAVFPLQPPSHGGVCFYWLKLLEPFCHLKSPCVALGQA